MKKLTLLLVLLLVALFAAPLIAGAVNGIPFAHPQFETRWQRADSPVFAGLANRSWIWGPVPITAGFREPYTQSPGGERTVQYFDKSRMEVNQPAANPNDLWSVTNGLLVVEMIRGLLQVGDADFIDLGAGANIPVAGDPDNAFPTYASLSRVFEAPAGRRVGQRVTARFQPDGVGQFTQFANDPATEIVRLDGGFGIPRAFADFMQFRGTVFQNGRFVANQETFPAIYLVGLPVTDAFWTVVRVGGVERPVMFQAFERRLLTYTPGNPPGFLVEMGNVGQHYLKFRYATSGEGRPVIIIQEPLPGARIAGTAKLLGQASASFENTLGVRVVTVAGEVLGQGSTIVEPFEAGAAGGPGIFGVSLAFRTPAVTQPGFVEVFDTSAATGAIIRIARLPVTIVGAADTSQVNVFFSRPELLNGPIFVSPTPRTIERTVAVGRAALEELFFGPTPEEELAEFGTGIPFYHELVRFPARSPEFGYRVKLRSLSIQDGTAFADFSRELDTVAGSLRVSVVRQQIERTLLQFPTVNRVVISVEGRTGDILQP